MSPIVAMPLPAVSPYKVAADGWWPTGWRGLLPLEYGTKDTPPAGYTGQAGRWPKRAQVERWAASVRPRNVALRLPEGVIGLDVDGYGTKTGGRTLTEHEDSHGPLPPTWTVTSRTDGVSGVRLYRTSCVGPFRSVLAGGHVDVIHTSHRYVTLPPSMHPEHRLYFLIGPDGHPTQHVPRPEDLPWLPEPWHDAVARARPSKASTARSIATALVQNELSRDEEAQQWPCRQVQATVQTALDNVPEGERHRVVRDLQLTLLHLRKAGHVGVATAIEQLRQVFLEQVDRPTAPSEFDRALDGAWLLLMDDPHPHPYAVCSCTLDLWERAVAQGLGLSKGSGRDNEQAVLTFFLAQARRSGSRLITGQSQRTIGEQANIHQPRVTTVIKRLLAHGYIEAPGLHGDTENPRTPGRRSPGTGTKDYVLTCPRGVLEFLGTPTAVEVHIPVEGVFSFDTRLVAQQHPLFAATGLGKGVGETFRYLPHLPLVPDWDGKPTADSVALRVGRLPDEPTTLSSSRRLQPPLLRLAPTLEELVVHRGRGLKTVRTHLDILVRHGLALEAHGRWYRTLFDADWLLEHLGFPDVTSTIKARNELHREGYLAAQEAYRDQEDLTGARQWIDRSKGEYLDVATRTVVRPDN